MDAIGRILARSLSAHLKETVIVSNVAGATGRRAAVQVAHARPDGRTLLMGTSATHAIAPSVFPRLSYRPDQDFTAVGSVCSTRLLLVANPAFEARSLEGLIAVSQAASLPLLYGSWGTGSGGHLVAEAIRLHRGIDLSHVPYQGIRPMMQDLLGGQIPLAVSDMAGALALAREGKVIPLVISGTSRYPQLPQVATLAESGVPFTTESWCALFAPARTPGPVLARLESALRAALAEVSVQQALRVLGYESEPLGREVFLRQWQLDIAAWRRIVVATGIRLD
ncbi:Bug family tripartite tricarboxylate transporter substrate binding protein [Variovorax saccharolyticus]|uniref:Bug family tripartite tricarboxylate transporter substrate binding protein n=1 Tax=Variovorax saccharolyticus TaxID=3053516 RepID=UPI002577E20B|nr:tripartite tricarboxylate transporter substrate binding protein [Variovorax sp. J31P216]MDM0028846.1 tripartite tricarboxylate transporter substrate binding protein [Variovorax sp. J31P216]